MDRRGLALVTHATLVVRYDLTKETPMALTNGQRQKRWRAARKAELLALRKIVAAEGLANPNAPKASQRRQPKKQTQRAAR